jgi:cytochrome c oxidase assembly protein subunit 15
MSLEEFKKIYWMEWIHRELGRTIGLVFGLPYLYYLLRGKLKGKLLFHCTGLLMLGAFQGFLGWYMVKSGLDHQKFEENNSVPRVSHYRLAIHLGTALMLYSFMYTIALKLINPTKLVQYKISNINLLHKLSHSTMALTFITALSGALVAGLDAGLIYNTFPLMGNQWIPEDLMILKPWYKNFFENDTTVQFDHRILGISTFLLITTFYTIMLKNKKNLPKHIQNGSHLLMFTALIQVSLGISTLISFVPIELAASHQAGALTLFTISLWLMHHLKRIPKI